jgi:predicted nuclease of predicted toxin-antitoxin system
MKILIDMNLSPKWTTLFREAGYESIHWSQIGHPSASDEVILNYAKDHGCVVFTHDLDFGAILAATHAEAPSVIQIRTQDVAPASLAKSVIALLQEFQGPLGSGALVSLDESTLRVRVLPVGRRKD